MGLSGFRRFDASDNPAADYAAGVSAKDIVNGRLVSGVLPSGKISINLNHGLGRAFKGAICAGTGHPTTPLTAYTPADAQSSGADVTKQFIVVCTGVAASDINFIFWVF